MIDRIEDDLRWLAADVHFPPTPDLRTGVLERIGADHAGSPHRPRFARSLVLAVLLALLLAATVVAAAAFLLPGFSLTFVPTLPGEPPERLGADLTLGEPVSPDSVTVPLARGLGAPDEAYVAHDGEVVSVVYGSGDGVPAIHDTGVGVLLQVISGSLDTERVRKLAVERDVTVSRVEVNGSPAFWIEGEPHLVTYYSPSGAERTEMTRLVGDTLVWQRDDAIYRLESALGREAAIRVAESIDD